MLDISQVPANTIAYTVANQPPPVSKDVNWQTADFWSRVFNDPMGISILNAVAKNMPVKIKTRVENWKDPNIHLASATTEETKKEIIRRYTYVWQDFDIEVDAKNSILVKYNRGVDSEEIRIQKESAWGALLTGLGFLVAFVAAGVALGAIGSTAPAVGAVTPAATGVTLTVPSVTAPSLTGMAGYSELMALGTGVSTSIGVPAIAAAIPVVETVGTATVAGSGIFTKVLSAAKVAAAVTSAGVGLWSEVQKAKISEAMKEEGIAETYQQYIPDGMTSGGNFVYKKAAAVTEIDYKKLGLIGLGGLILLLLLTGGGPPPVPTYYPMLERK